MFILSNNTNPVARLFTLTHTHTHTPRHTGLAYWYACDTVYPDSSDIDAHSVRWWHSRWHILFFDNPMWMSWNLIKFSTKTDFNSIRLTTHECVSCQLIIEYYRYIEFDSIVQCSLSLTSHIFSIFNQIFWLRSLERKFSNYIPNTNWQALCFVLNQTNPKRKAIFQMNNTMLIWSNWLNNSKKQFTSNDFNSQATK